MIVSITSIELISYSKLIAFFYIYMKTDQKTLPRIRNKPDFDVYTIVRLQIMTNNPEGQAENKTGNNTTWIPPDQEYVIIKYRLVV